MSRFRCLCVICGMVAGLASSMEFARAKDKDPKQPQGQGQGGGQPGGGGGGGAGRGAGVNQGQGSPQGNQRQFNQNPGRDAGKNQGNSLPQFQPKGNNNNVQGNGGQPKGGSGQRGSGGGNPGIGNPGLGNPNGGNPAGGGLSGGGKGIGNPQGNPGRVKGDFNPGTGNPGGLNLNGGQGNNSGKLINPSNGNLVDNASPLPRDRVRKPKISVEPGAEQQMKLGDKTGILPLDPKGSPKLNTLPDTAGSQRGGGGDSLKLGNQKTKPLVISKNGRSRLDVPKGGAGDKVALPLDADKLKGTRQDDQFKDLFQAKKRDDFSRELKRLRDTPDAHGHPELKHLNLDKISGVHQERLAKPDHFQNWQQSQVGQKLGLKQQFDMQRQGDLSRRMNLSVNLINAGGWAQHRQHGLIAAGFTTGAFSVWYAGGGCYPSHSWCPVWSPWVSWCYWDTCPIYYDPRPYYCIPIVYNPCVPWVYYDYPVWNPLPLVACGTWIDVSPVVVTAQDLQLLAVRFVDNGHPEQNLGPRYRAWVRNNSPVQVVTPFSVLMLATNEQAPTVEAPQMGVVVPSMDIGETIALDIRLPLSANRLGTTPEGYRVPFTYLHALVDSHQQIPETFENNNGAVLQRSDILPVDPAAFSTDLTASAPESLLNIAGEGFGPEPGQVIVSVYGQQVQAEIHGWYDLGIRFEVPNFSLTQAVDAEVLVVRGDNAVSNPLTVRLSPKGLLEEAAPFPDAPVPSPPQ